MTRAVLCVPNFSEGRDKDVMDSISKAIIETPGCSLLDVSAGESTNRSVYTFAGNPETVVLGALNSAKIAHQLIDMSKHEGMRLIIILPLPQYFSVLNMSIWGSLGALTCTNACANAVPMFVCVQVWTHNNQN